MDQGMKTYMYPVTDAAQAKTLYSTLLGADPYVDEPYYVGFRVGGQEIGLVPNGHKQGMTGPVGYWEVADIEKVVQSLLDAGARIQQQIHDVGGGKMIASVRDVDNNSIGLMQSP